MYNNFSGHHLSGIDESALLNALKITPGFGFHQNNVPETLETYYLDEINHNSIQSAGGLVSGWSSTLGALTRFYVYSANAIGNHNSHHRRVCYTAPRSYSCNCVRRCSGSVVFGSCWFGSWYNDC